MAYPLLPAPIQNENKEKVIYKTIQKGIHGIKTKTPLLLDAFVLVIIAFLYFLFTGIALCLNRQLPKEWLKIATHLTKEKIAKKIQGKETIVKPNSMKVVDLETGNPIPLKP